MESVFESKRKSYFIAIIPFILYFTDPFKRDMSLKLALVTLLWSFSLIAVDLLLRKNKDKIIIGYIVIAVVFTVLYFVI